MHSQSVCSEDCFHCPYPDCVRDDLTAATYADLALIEKTIINPPTAKQRKLATRQRAYREANKEKVAARHRAYREANRRKRKKAPSGTAIPARRKANNTSL